jgi:hypothetical protein
LVFMGIVMIFSSVLFSAALRIHRHQLPLAKVPQDFQWFP